MTLIRSGRGKLTQLVADHVFSDENRVVHSSVVHSNRVPNHVRDNRGPSGPRLYWPFFARLVHRIYLLQKVIIDEEAFFNTSCHSV